MSAEVQLVVPSTAETAVTGHALEVRKMWRGRVFAIRVNLNGAIVTATRDGDAYPMHNWPAATAQQLARAVRNFLPSIQERAHAMAPGSRRTRRGFRDFEP